MRIKNILIKLLLIIILLFNLPTNNIFAQITLTTSKAKCGKGGSASVTVNGGTPPYKYKWSRGEPSDGASVGNLTPGGISVVITDKNECSGSASGNVENDDKDCECKTCPPPKPPPIPVIGGGDPNDITGPSGFGLQRWVSVNDELPYTIRFENDPKIATSSVNKVIVTHPIDKSADMFSFRLGDIGFRNFIVPVPANTSYFFKRLDLVDSIGVILYITAGLDVTRRQAFWIFQAFDPKTGLPNIDPFKGFLAINDSTTHQGEGKVQFSIKPKFTSNTGDTIKAFASIVFDVNEAIVTNIEFNNIDAHPPVSKVISVKSVDFENKIVAWNGHDDVGGCGINSYKILISKDEEPYYIISSGLSDTSTILPLNSEYSYKIKTIAADNVNNIEYFSSVPDTVVKATHKDFFITPNHKSKYCIGSKLETRWNKFKDVFSFYLQMSADSGKTFTNFGQQILASDSIFSWNTQALLAGNKYYIIRAINSANNLPIDTSEFFLIKDNITVNAGADKALCVGDSVQIGGSPTASNGILPYTYQWSSSENLIISSLSNPYVSEGGSYTVTVTDSLGCSNSDAINIDERQLPNVYVEGMNISYCLNSANDTLIGNPQGGVFTGAGMTGSIFNPSVAGIGTHNILYSYTDSYGCTNGTSLSTIVNEPPSVSFTGLNTSYCMNSDTVELTGTPIGGTFLGDGVIDSLFIPAIAGAGTHYITYSYTNEEGCSNSQTQAVTIIDLPNITISGLDTSYCLNADTIELVGLPSGGVFTGNGIVGSKFVPTLAGVGTHSITYSYSDQYGCSNSSTQPVTVINIPNVDFSGLDSTYCHDASIATLTGTPANGVFSGNGITGDSFNPTLAGVGLHDITYTFTDQNGCSNKKVKKVKVNSTPNVSFTGLNQSYCLNSVASTLVGSPAGGLFTGNGVLGNRFLPSTAGVGTHQVTYSYTDQNACSGKQVQSVVVNSLPAVSFSGLDSSYCVNKGDVSLTGTPSGGHFSGNGIMGSTFNTSAAGIGSHFISYSFADGNGCSNETSKSVKVNPLPSIYLGRDTSITTVEFITLSAGNGYKTYLWSNGSTGQTLTLNGAVLGKGTHKVWVEVTDNNSCAAADTIIIKVTDNVGIDMFSSKVKLQVYPNPSSGLFNLEIANSSSENIYIEIRSNSGQLVYSKKFKGRYEDVKAEIDLTGNAKGVYYISVKVKRESVMRKIVII